MVITAEWKGEADRIWGAFGAGGIANGAPSADRRR
jgi:hypothetical protein